MKNWCKRHVVHLLISTVGTSLAVLHILYPASQVDTITIVLFVIAALPWLGSIFKSVEFPGGGGLEYQDLEKAGKDASRVGLLSSREGRTEDQTRYAALAAEDPNLALAGLRIDLERQLRQMAEKNGIDVSHKGIGQLMKALQSAGELSVEQVSVLSDLVGLLNRAVHGADIDRRSAEWAVDAGPRLLGSLQVSEAVILGDQFSSEVTPK